MTLDEELFHEDLDRAERDHDRMVFALVRASRAERVQRHLVLQLATLQRELENARAATATLAGAIVLQMHARARG